MKARIMDKTHIQHLSLEWSCSGDITTSTVTEREISDKLQPHECMKKLTIKRYRGTRFPDWVGHSSYHNMTHISLKSLSNCCMLPSLGQLPCLKSLEIADFEEVETIGVEFYKNDNDHSSLETPFPSLEHLSFHKMPSWEVWHLLESDAFPQLKWLTVSNCPILTGGLPDHLPALEKLIIARCEQLVSSLPCAPTIRELHVSKSNKVRLHELPTSLQYLSIEGCEVVESMFSAITITQPTCLRSLSISNCSSAVSFPGHCLPKCLKKLRIWNCEKLRFPKQQHQPHELLESLSIYNICDSLTSFPLEAFPNLKHLTIVKCENLESLSVSQVSSLHYLDIRCCPNFVPFPVEGFAAPSMTVFRVLTCNKLKSLPCYMYTLLPNLRRLEIIDCMEIDSFPEGGLPPNLTTLEIRNCEKLLSSLSSMGKHEGLTLLNIGENQSVESFPQESLLPQLPSLRTLYINGFKTMETLNCKGLLHLTSLEVLTIRNCPKLNNLTTERLPPSLIKLQIYETPSPVKHCQEKHIEIWPKISHVPGIQVDGRWIC